MPESKRDSTSAQDQAGSGPGTRTGGVQSISRAFVLLETMADCGGIAGLSQLAARSGLPLPTIHRLMRTLVDLGYVRQEASREYALGPRIVRLGDSASGLLDRWAAPRLRQLVELLGESANLAMLDGDHAMYVAQVPGRHSMRMFTEVGRRVAVHSTAVGKAMLARMPPARVDEILARTGLASMTDRTIVDPARFADELAEIREQGYSTDDGEQEIGVRCVAVALPGRRTRAALSISGPQTRMTADLIGSAVPLLRDAASALAAELNLAATAQD
jgi:IclR family transcriptional regulator, acetate operon repressor